MNCSQTKSKLVAFISAELPDSERAAVQAHLAICEICQADMDSLAQLETRLTRHLQLQAEQVGPTPQAWASLQRRIAHDGSGRVGATVRSLVNRVRFEWPAPRRLALAALVILLLLWAVPPVRTLAARFGEWAGTWFQFNTPGTGSSMAIGGFEAFTPYAPRYLPEGFDSSGSGGATAPDLDQLTLTYSRGAEFVTLIQSKGSGAGDLPEGEYVYLDGISGVYVPDFAASSGQLQEKIPSIPIITSFDYRATSLLAWYSGPVKIELVSNLPQGEILRIAHSLELVQNSGGAPLEPSP